MSKAGAFAFGLAALVAIAGAVAQPPAPGLRTAETWWAPGDGRAFPRELDYTNANGMVRTLLLDGPMATDGHPFFSALGPNGRACVTCHQPADAMSLSIESARERWAATGGDDPLFAMLDGANCPNLPRGERASHSMLLDHGLIRIERVWPPLDQTGKAIKPDFKLEVVRDPAGCNAGSYGPAKGKVSVYRRPRPVTNLKYLTAIGFAYDPKDGLPLDLDRATGKPASGNLTADARVLSLDGQARDAMRTHLGITGKLNETAIAGIVGFEMRLSTAQAMDFTAGMLNDGAYGGPGQLETSQPGQLGSIGRAVWSEFEPWEKLPADAKLTAEQKAFRESIARGARVFREKTFLITDSAGINSPIGFGNPVRNSCVFCHNMSQMGNDVAPGQVDIGTTTAPFADPAPHLPLFRVTCTDEPHPHYGREIFTSDPGYALTTGRCSDVGKITLQSMRGLAARAPYFSNGSANTLRDIVEFYERRYNIGYTEQEKQDLVNLMSVL
jgi:hypothetical protein